MNSIVVLQKGDDRYQNVRQALSVLKSEIKRKIEAKKSKNIIIKPNFVSVNVPLCATHVEAVKALLDFLNRPAIIAEGAAVGETFEGFRNYNYFEKLKNYPVEFKDLNKDETVGVELLDNKFQLFTIGVSKTLVDRNNFLISIGPIKTHDTVIVTLSIKNVTMGAPLKIYKTLVHQGHQVTNLNLARLAKVIYPDLSILDGFLAMEGDGPTHGDPVKMKIALTSLDALACDTVATELMGFDPDKAGYLYYIKKLGKGCGDLGKIKIVGNTTLEDVKQKFKPPPTYKEQLKWQIKQWSELI
jgi:uncharacterized protein (DUF362 family)